MGRYWAALGAAEKEYVCPAETDGEGSRLAETCLVGHSPGPTLQQRGQEATRMSEAMQRHGLTQAKERG